MSCQSLGSFFGKERVTILVTDSGLGGMAVAADLVEKMRSHRVFRHMQVVFFNALFAAGSGYNRLEEHSEKVRIFDNALESMYDHYRPDLLLIACNTLSVIYSDTPFSQKALVPAVGIVRAGVELIAESLESDPQSKVIIFATKTTLEVGSHRKSLVELGFSRERIIEQPCPGLATSITRGYASLETRTLMEGYIAQALTKLKDSRSPLYVSLNCTHYGYALGLWDEIFRRKGFIPRSILDPNPKMLEFLSHPSHTYRYEKNHVDIKVVSMVKIAPESIESIGSLIRSTSPIAGEALAHYDWNKNLFKWRVK